MFADAFIKSLRMVACRASTPLIYQSRAKSPVMRVCPPTRNLGAAGSGRSNKANSDRGNGSCGTCSTWCIAQCALESDFGGSKIHNCGSNHKTWTCSTKRVQVPHSGNRNPTHSRACQPPFPCSNACGAAQLHGSALKDQLRDWVLAQPRRRLSLVDGGHRSPVDPCLVRARVLRRSVGAATSSCARAKPSRCNLADDRRGVGLCQRLELLVVMQTRNALLAS